MEVKNIQKWAFQIKAGKSEGRTEERNVFLQEHVFEKSENFDMEKNDLNTEWKVALVKFQNSGNNQEMV